MVTVHVQLPADQLDQLDACARAHDRSRAAEIRRAVRLYLTMMERQRANGDAPVNGLPPAA